MHTNSNRLFEKCAVPCFQLGMRVLEIGPDLFPSTYRKLLPLADITWDTLDIYAAPQLTYPKSDVYSFAIPDNTYDIVFSGNVIEHVAKVWRWVPELARITKPGGLVITINPTSWPYHPAPIDCWRIYPDGMQALCDEAGLKVELSFFGSLELPHTKRALPGRAPEWQSTRLRRAFRFLGWFGFPVEKAFDTITIARKPA